MEEFRTINCSCGEMVKVSLSSAGETVVCPACQKEIEIPSWRELKNYPVYTELEVPASNAARNPAKSGSELDRRLGWMLVFGLLMAIFGLIALYNGYIYYNSVLVAPDQWDCYETWVNWQFLRPGIDTPLTQSEQDWFFQLRELRRWVILFGSLASVCFLLLLYFWIKPYKRAKQ